MPSLHIHLEGDGALNALAAGATGVIHLQDDVHVTGLAHGTVEGKPTVAFGFLLPDGRAVIAETTLVLLLFAADALKARFGDPRR